MNLTKRPDTTEIEMGLLGGLMKNNAGLLDIDLRPDELREGHDRIFTRFQELYREKGSFSPLDFTDWQMNETMVQGMNAHEHVRQCYLFNTTSSTDQLRDYVEMIRETHRKVRLLEMAETIIADAWERPYHDLAAELAAKLEEVAPASDFLTGEELCAAVLKSLEMPRRRFPVGIPELDTAMGGGLYEGFIYGFCGAEKMGKTTLAHTLSYNLDKAGTKHLYIALEMDSVQIEQRNIARDLGINSLEFLKPNHPYASAAANIPLSKNMVLKDALMGGMKAVHAKQNRQLASIMLAPFMGRVGANADLQAMLDKLRPLRESTEAWIRHFGDGTPIVLSSENMDFHNSLQVMSASQHVVCKQPDFALAKRFMVENPHHRGFYFAVN